jgi:hypothetical protein
LPELVIGQFEIPAILAIMAIPRFSLVSDDFSSGRGGSSRGKGPAATTPGPDFSVSSFFLFSLK